jgi:hypothetical protein
MTTTTSAREDSPMIWLAHGEERDHETVFRLTDGRFTRG